MNYEYTEPFLEIRFSDGNMVQIKKSAITDIYAYKNDTSGKPEVKVNFNRGNSSTWYRFDGTKEEFDKNSRIVYL